MDTFDAAFLLLSEKAAGVPFEKCTCVCLKSDKDVQAWGPESRLIGDIVIGAWQRKAKGFLSGLRTCYEIEPKLKIHKARITTLFKDHKNIGKATWKIVEKKVRKLLEATTERSIQYFIGQAKQQKKAHKADETFDPTISYDMFLAELAGDHIASFMERYPEAILHPEIDRLSHYLRASDEVGPLDKYYVKERLDAIQHKEDSYLEGMTDVEVGRAWTATGVELAYRNNIAEYMIVAQMDSPNRPCPVCQALHGKSFSVVQAKENVDHVMGLKGTEDFAKEAPFPRIGDLRNLSTEEMHARGELPSFHGSCRCDVVFSWGGEIPVAQRYKPVAPKAKIIKFIPAKNKLEATKYAKEQLGMQQVDFGKLDMEVINEMNRTVKEMYDEYPAMQGELKFLGSSQARNDVRLNRGEQTERNKIVKYWKDNNIPFDKDILEQALAKEKKTLRKFFKVGNEYASATPQSWKDLRGISVNEKWGGKGKSKSKDSVNINGTYIELSKLERTTVFKSSLKKDKKGQWLATGDIHGTMLHEFGHQIAYTLREKDSITRERIESYRNDIFKSLGEEKAIQGLSQYAWQPKATKEEFVAESWAEYSEASGKGEEPRAIAKYTGGVMSRALNSLEKLGGK